MTLLRTGNYILIAALALAVPAVVGAASDEEALNESPPEDVNVEFRWDEDRLFMEMEAGETRVKFDSEAGEYEVYIPENPDSEDDYFRENDLLISIDEDEDRITVTARGDKETIRKKLDEIVEGDLAELEEGETDGIKITETDDGYEIIIEGKNGPTRKIEKEND